MKTLAVTFFTAIAIVCVAIVCDMASGRNTTEDSGLVGKTILTHDSEGRITSELTIAINGKEWQETSMKQLSYYDNKVEAVTYNKVNGAWTAASKVVTESVNGEPANSTYFEADPSGKWVAVAEQKGDDLSDDEVVDDMVFDAEGNLVMKATYVYKGDNKVGISKEEYGYEGSTQKSRVSYAWVGNAWNKTVSAKLIAE